MSEDPKNRIRQAVNARMEELGIQTYVELAEAAGRLDPDTITALLDDKRKRPHLRTRMGLGQALRWPTNWLEFVRRGETPPDVGYDEDGAARSSSALSAGDVDAVDLKRGAGGRDVTDLEAYAQAAIAAEHERRKEQLARVVRDYVSKHGFSAHRSASDTGPDLVLERDDEVVLVELKTVTPANERAQVRMAIGQLLDHHQQTPEARLLLITDFPLSDEAPRRLLQQVDIRVAWPGDWTALEDTTTERGTT